jgi:hypothetical protein
MLERRESNSSSRNLVSPAIIELNAADKTVNGTRFGLKCTTLRARLNKYIQIFTTLLKGTRLYRGHL